MKGCKLMRMTDKLDMLMSRSGLTRGSLAKAADIPYTTVVGLYDKGYDNVKLSTLKKLAAALDTTIEYLGDDTLDLPYTRRVVSLADDALLTARRYNELSPHSKLVLDSVMDALEKTEREEADSAGDSEPEFIREYVTPAAAGYASPALGEDYTLIPREASVPRDADFAVRISGDSMEPYIHDGARVYVRQMSELQNGDVGIFCVDGDMKCKQYCEDILGNIYLFSLNRDRSDADVEVRASSGRSVYCFGRVILPRRPPLPRG